MDAMSNEAVDLQARLDQLEKMLQQSNAEKQQWKQCAHTLADALEGVKVNPGFQPHRVQKAENALEQFKELRDQ